MKFVKALKNIIGKFPYLILRNLCFGAYSFLDTTLKISLVSILHNNAQHLSFLIIEGFFIADDKWRLDGGQEPDLVESILFILLFEFLKLYLYQGGVTCFMA